MPLSPVPNYPTSLDSLPDPTSATYTDDDGFELDLLAQKHNAILEVVEGKVGISEAAAQDTPLANTVLGSSTNGKSKWRQVATADIAANAVTQRGIARGTTSNPTTASTTYVDLTEMSVTLTTTGGDLLVFWGANIHHNTIGALVTFGVSLDGAAEVDEHLFAIPAAAVVYGQTDISYFAAPAAGSHTVKVRWKVSAGTGTAYLTLRRLLVIEVKK